MILNYNKKYKDRDPITTINIIKTFFNHNNFNVQIAELQQNNSTTWSSHLKLYFKNLLILSANGKGINEDFCLASGYSELYERFCNKIFTLSNYVGNKQIMDLSYANNNFYFSPNEKEIKFEDSFQSIMGQYFLSHMQNNPNQLKNFFSLIFNNKFIGVPYINPVSKDTIYLDPRFITILNNSSGMAAGNSFYEAFNQGMSELYEHIVNGQHYFDVESQYYAIDLSIITNPYLKDIIANIQKDNDLYIIDLSYNFNVPVLMSLIVNKLTHAITINFGSFPVIDIAIERVLTELYQGISSQNKMKLNGQIPFNNYIDVNLLEVHWPGCTMTRPIFPEFILNKLKIKYNFNADVFLINNEYSNEEIYNYILALNKKLNLDVYYHNCSLTQEMYAIQIFIYNFPYLLDNFNFADAIPDKTDYLLFLLKLYTFIHDYLDNKTDLRLLNELIEQNKYFSDPYSRYYLTLLQGRKNQFIVAKTLTSSQNILEFINKIKINDKELFAENSDIPKFVQENIPYLYDDLITYIIIKRYLNVINYYTEEELITIFTFLKLNYTAIDLQECYNNSSDYWIEKIFLKELRNFQSDEYKEYFAQMAKLYWAE